MDGWIDGVSGWMEHGRQSDKSSGLRIEPLSNISGIEIKCTLHTGDK